MINIYYDTEFIDDGHLIDLISIGLVKEYPDGSLDSLYLINDELDLRKLANQKWHMEHTVPHLPIGMSRGVLYWNNLHPDGSRIKRKIRISEEVSAFIQSPEGEPKAELWAWYAAYDHVVLAQLWGPMSELPPWVPMRTNDLKQECVRLGDPEVPAADPELDHHALHDAHRDRRIHLFLKNYEKEHLPPRR